MHFWGFSYFTLYNHGDNDNHQDQRDYCDREQREDWLGTEHTMCKFCGLGDKYIIIITIVSMIMLIMIHDHNHDDDHDGDREDDHDVDCDADDDGSPRCPYFIDPANNDLTGRVIEETHVKELIVQLHNEVGFLSSPYY